MEARVFLVEPVRKDFSLDSLKEFGEVRYLFNIDERRGSIFRTDEFCANVRERLKREGFNAEVDFFCLTGGLVPTSLTLSLLAHMFHQVNVLLFNTGDESYASRTVHYETNTTCSNETQTQAGAA